MPKATGAIASIPGSLASASASSRVSFWVEPPSAPGSPTVSARPGLMAIRLVPNWVNMSMM